MALVSFLNTCCFGEVTGLSFIDSTSVAVCHIKRAKAHKTFKGWAGWGKSSVGWYFGFKVHLIINDHGELLAVALTPGNTDDRKPVPDMTQDLVGKLFGDRGYISQALFESLFARGLELITKRRKNMKNALMPLLDKILLRKRPIIETVNDQRKNLCQNVREACRRQTFAPPQSFQLPRQSGLGPDRLRLPPRQAFVGYS